MALSNWDHAAWDKFGDPRDGSLKFHSGIWLEIYKDWLYIHDPTTKGAFIHIRKGEISVYNDKREETITEISEGKLSYKGIEITVHRDEEHGTFIHAECGGWYEGNYYHDCLPMILCGIGKYGFCGEEWVGIEEDDVEAFGNWLKDIKSPIAELGEAQPYNQGDAYFCGTDKAKNRYKGAHNTVISHLMGWNK